MLSNNKYEDDIKAAEELASEMGQIEAIKFLRSETGRSLSECYHWAEQIMGKYPNSALAVGRKPVHMSRRPLS